MTKEIIIDNQNYDDVVIAQFKPYVMPKDAQISKNEIE